MRQLLFSIPTQLVKRALHFEMRPMARKRLRFPSISSPDQKLRSSLFRPSRQPAKNPPDRPAARTSQKRREAHSHLAPPLRQERGAPSLHSGVQPAISGNAYLSMLRRVPKRSASGQSHPVVMSQEILRARSHTTDVILFENGGQMSPVFVENSPDLLLRGLEEAKARMNRRECGQRQHQRLQSGHSVQTGPPFPGLTEESQRNRIVFHQTYQSGLSFHPLPQSSPPQTGHAPASRPESQPPSRVLVLPYPPDTAIKSECRPPSIRSSLRPPALGEAVRGSHRKPTCLAREPWIDSSLPA